MYVRQSLPAGSYIVRVLFAPKHETSGAAVSVVHLCGSCRPFGRHNLHAMYWSRVQIPVGLEYFCYFLIFARIHIFSPFFQY